MPFACSSDMLPSRFPKPIWLFFCALISCADMEGAEYRMEGHLNPPDRGSEQWVLRHSCVEQMDRPAFTWGEYRAVLNLLQNPRYVVVPLHEFEQARQQYPDKVVVGMRHDLDGNICKASKMARIEQEIGIRSTYFLRHTDSYYSFGWPNAKRREDMVWRYKQFQEFGHEVGLHYDVLSLALEYGLDPDEIMQNELLFLRGNGLEIFGAASHGSPSAIRNHYTNYEFFAGMTTRETITNGARTVPVGEHTLAEYSLQYEAYALSNEHYYSDVSGHWGPAHPLDALPSIPAGESAILLTHPVWWGSEDEAF